MKRITKKLMATVLALAMILSLAVTASASSASNPVVDYDSGSARGTITDEGKEPKNKINIILPVDNTTIYDMFLDPHGLIEKTDAERYVHKYDAQGFDSDVTADSFAHGSNVYFKNTVAEGRQVTLTVGEDKYPVYARYEYHPATGEVQEVTSTETLYYDSTWYKADGTAASVTIAPTASDAEKAAANIKSITPTGNTVSITPTGGSATDMPEYTVVKITTPYAPAAPEYWDATPSEFAVHSSGAANGAGKWYEVTPGSRTIAATITTTDLSNAISGTPEGNDVKSALTGDAAKDRVEPYKADAISYTNTSDAVKIINKSNITIGVTMSANVIKGAGNKFSFVGKDALASAETPAMYLALSAKNGTAAVSDTTNETVPAVSYAAGVTENKKGWVDSISFAWASDVTDTAKDALSEVLEEIGYTSPVFTLTATVNASGTTWGIAHDQTSAIPGLTETQISTPPASLVGTVGTTKEDLSYTFYYVEQDEEEETVVTEIGTLEVAMLEVDDYERDVTAPANGDTVAFSLLPLTASGKVSAGIKANKDAYERHANAGDYYVAGDSNRYVWVLSTGVSNDKFQKEEFKLVSSINANDDWDDVNSSNIHLDVIWDAHEYDADIDGELPPDIAPTVTVTQAGASETGEVKLAYTLGSGLDAMTKVDKVMVGTKNVNDATIEDGVITFTLTSTLWKTKTVTVQFADGDGKTSKAAVDYTTEGATANAA